MATARATIDHGTIKRWVEEHGGCPAHVKRSSSKNDPGILRIDFSGYSGKQSLEQISWDDFFETFEENELAFLYADEEGSRFSKFVSRDSTDLDERSESESGSARRSPRGRSSSATGKKSAAGRGSRTTSRSKSSSASRSSSPKSKTAARKSRGSSGAASSSTRSRGAAAGGKSAATKSRAKSGGNGRSAAASTRKRSGANGAGKRTAAETAEEIAGPDAIDLLMEQHREVEELFEKLESARGTAQKERVFAKLADALAAHTKIEEEIFYPSVFSRKTETELRESVEEHLVAKRLVADMLAMEASNSQFMSKAAVLKEVVRHHVEEEEHQLFPEVREQGAEDLDEIGGRLQERYEQLMAREPRKQVPKESRSAAIRF